MPLIEKLVATDFVLMLSSLIIGMIALFLSNAPSGPLDKFEKICDSILGVCLVMFALTLVTLPIVMLIQIWSN